MCDQQSLRSACAYAQSDQSLCWSLEYYTSVKLVTEHYLEFLSFIGGCTGSSESTLVKMPHCRKSHVSAHLSDIPTITKNSSRASLLLIQFLIGCFNTLQTSCSWSEDVRVVSTLLLNYFVHFLKKKIIVNVANAINRHFVSTPPP